jgi:hypothetical protein
MKNDMYAASKVFNNIYDVIRDQDKFQFYVFKWVFSILVILAPILLCGSYAADGNVDFQMLLVPIYIAFMLVDVIFVLLVLGFVPITLMYIGIGVCAYPVVSTVISVVFLLCCYLIRLGRENQRLCR